MIRLAVALLIAVATWNTERFQRWAFPEAYYAERVRAIHRNIAFGRTMIQEAEDELATLVEPDSREVAEAYIEIRRELHADIQSEEEMIALWQQELLEARQGLSQFRGDL